MGDGTKIEWTDATWNPITGCSVVSPGCTNCYAMRLAGTRLQHHPSRAGLTRASKAGPVWTGDVKFNEEWLLQPIQWRRPRMIFVCAHGDLFHENVPDEWIDRVFAVMALAPQHVFQVLTKRLARMRDYMISRRALNGNIGGEAVRAALEDGRSEFGGVSTTYPAKAAEVRETAIERFRAGLPNVWLGTSVEDQTRADERIPLLLATPAAVRWLSMEPLLGPVDLKGWIYAHWDGDRRLGRTAPYIRWIVLGGESGPGARPMHLDWARSVRDQCAAAGVPLHFKQWGNYQPAGQRTKLTAIDDGEGRLVDLKHELASRKKIPLDGYWSYHVGKKAAGRLLDGVEHNGMPA